MASELERLFQEMVDLTAEERERRFESQSVPERLRQEVRELIQHDRTDNNRLERALGNVAAEALSTDHWTGTTAGAYRLDRLLGHGGMGAVYLGERSDGIVEHQAAIKVIHTRAPGLIERFLRERQILATLSHPNIAQLLDAGEMAGGIPFFAMEYCDGEAIDTYCKRQNLDTRSILELFLPVCSAVHYAHQRMIIHRDLKPSNILVSSNGVPKLLDFGIAKILDDPAIEPTQTGARLLTLQFASPEQIRGEMVSAASDVYSLGAVLYLMLTGHYIRETTSGSFAPAMLDANIVRPRIWQPLLPSDIENIVMTALRREPEARYSSAEALAEDLRRFLRFLPVQATPPSLGYRAGRFFRRNPVATIVTTLAVIAMLGATAFSIYQARQAMRNLSDVRQMANVMLFDFERSIRHLPGTQEARHRVVDTARSYLEKIAPQAGNDASLQREVADAYLSLAEVEYTSSLSRQGAEEAIRSLQKSLNIRRQLNDAASTQPERLLPFIDSASKLCARSIFVGKMTVARDSCTEALDLAQQWLKKSPEDRSAKLAAQQALLHNTLLLEADGKAEEARQSIVRSFDLATGLSRDEPGNPELLGKLARAARVYAELLLTIKQPMAAIAPAEIAVKTSQALLGLDPRNVTWRIDAAASLLAAGSTHRQASLEKGKKEVHLARAGALLENALEINGQTVQLDPLSSSAQDSLIVTSHRLARVRETQHRYEDALTLYRDARELIQQRVDRDPTRRNLYLMGNNLLSAADAQLLAGNRAEAAQT